MLKTLFATLFGIGTATAMASPVADTRAQQTGQGIEVIEVVGRYDKVSLRNKMNIAEKAFYDNFNLHVPIEFHVKCEYRKRLGTNIRRRVCEPYFNKTERARVSALYVYDPNALTRNNGNAYIDFKLSPNARAELRKTLQAKQEELNGLFITVMEENPDVFQDYLNFRKAQLALQNYGQKE